MFVSTTLLSFASPSKTPTGTRGPSFPFEPCSAPKCAAILSWVVQTSSLGFFQRSPLRRFRPVSPVPASLPERRFPFGSVLPSTKRLPPVSFLTTPTVYSSPKLYRFIAPCIQPWSSSCFLPRLQRPIFRSDAVLVAALKLAVHTLQSVPLNNSRNHVSVTRCLRAVEPLPVLNLEALLHC